jgi:hypothetical protein
MVRRFFLVCLLSAPAYAATFDGTQWLDSAPCSDLAGDKTFSVCAVVRVPQGTVSSSTGRAVYSAASGSVSTSYVALGMPDNLLVPEFTYRTGSSFYRARGSASLADGQQHTLFGVADDTLLELYVDGQLVAASSLGGTPSSRELCTTGALRRSTPSVNSFWVGEVVVPVRTWDRAVTAAEVQAGCGLLPPSADDQCGAPPRYNVGYGLPACSATVTTGCTLACSPERRQVQGGCDECFHWSGSAGAQWYEVQRTGVDHQSGPLTVGDTKSRSWEAYVDEAGETVAAHHPTQWCAAWDVPRPVYNRLYRYNVRSCKRVSDTQIECSPWDSAGTMMRPACHACAFTASGPQLCPAGS